MSDATVALNPGLKVAFCEHCKTLWVNGASLGIRHRCPAYEVDVFVPSHFAQVVALGRPASPLDGTPIAVSGEMLRRQESSGQEFFGGDRSEPRG